MIQAKVSSAKSAVCLCNGIPESEIRNAIRNGCHSLADLQNETFATVGPCGGSCTSKVCDLLRDELNSDLGAATVQVVSPASGKS